jgi:RNA polymerase sigma factor (sigma-70 family)
VQRPQKKLPDKKNKNQATIFNNFALGMLGFEIAFQGVSMKLDTSDKIIVSACLSGDRKAQGLLYERYKVPMFTICLRYGSDRSEAEDMLQEGFIAIFKDLYQYDSTKGELRHWMKRVMVNAALQILRKQKLQYVELIEGYQQVESNDVSVLSDMSAQELIRLIQNLPVGYRTVFNLYVMDGLTHQEIANELNISENTSKTQLFKAKKLIKKMITAVQAA